MDWVALHIRRAGDVRVLVTVAALLALVVVRDAVAGVPTDQLRGSIDLILKIVTDPELKKEAKTAERRKRIRAVVNQIFDFTEISQRSLGRHWQARTPAERDQFVQLFGDLLENAYITKMRALGAPILYPGEVIGGRPGDVTTRIITKKETEIPSTTHVMNNGTLGVYDVRSRASASSATTAPSSTRSSSAPATPISSRSSRGKRTARPGAREAGRFEAAKQTSRREEGARVALVRSSVRRISRDTPGNPSPAHPPNHARPLW